MFLQIRAKVKSERDMVTEKLMEHDNYRRTDLYAHTAVEDIQQKLRLSLTGLHLIFAFHTYWLRNEKVLLCTVFHET